MFFLLSFLLSSRAGTCALPILPSSFPEASTQDLIFDVTTTASTGACAGRSLWDILWSCLATTFACTWVSVHPNIPFFREKKASTRRWRIYLMLVSLIAPEIMILWAFKQLQGAVVIMKTVNNGYGHKVNTLKKEEKENSPLWTLTHAHYLQMGGYRLQCLTEDKDLIPSRFGRFSTVMFAGSDYEVWELPLSFETMKWGFNAGLIDLPFIRKDEILDKNGRDGLSKAIAILQLTWFIVQIAARVRQNLAVTGLELTTAALASLNIAMYFSWWSKPTDILCPTFVSSRRLQEEIQKLRQSTISSSVPGGYTGPSSTLKKHIEPSKPTSPNLEEKKRYTIQHIGAKEEVNLATHYCTDLIKALGDLGMSITSFPRKLAAELVNFASGLRDQVKTIWSKSSRPPLTFSMKVRDTISLIWKTITHLFLALIYYPILAILDSGKRVTTQDGAKLDGKDIDAMATFKLIFDDTKLRPIMDMVFFCEDVTSAPFSFLSALSGAVFGMVHLLAWNFKFPTHVEQVLWRTSSSIISGLCIFIMVIAFGYIIFKLLNRQNQSKKPKKGVNQLSDTLDAREYSGGPTGHTSSESSGESKAQDSPAASSPLNIADIACSVFAICFVATRISLISLSIIGLRALPASAFDTVQWSGFIPHI